MMRRPDFTGNWKVNYERSVLRVPPPKNVLVKIEHREPSLIQKMLFTDAEGNDQQMTFKYETGAETANSVNGAAARTRTWWEGLELVIETRMKLADRELHFKDCWSLSDDGRILTMAHRDDDLAGQTSVLEKTSQADATGPDK